MKLKLDRFYCVYLALMMMSFTSGAQVAFNFNPAIYGQSLEGLSFLQVINSSGEDVKGTVTIRVTENGVGHVLTAIIASVPFKRGMNLIDRAAFSAGRFSFGNNHCGLTLSQTGRFPEGDYEYCFEIEITDYKGAWNNTFFENCFVFRLQPLTPLLLINPADGDESCNHRPAFTWQLPAPLPADARCRLILSEVRDKQDIAEAVNYNMPIINQGNIFNNQLIFPAGAPELKEGKHYAWQVTVYSGKSILKKSEVWNYSVVCQTKKQELVGESYRALKEMEDGNFYIADKILRFSFDNPYSAGKLQYSISSISDPSQSLKGLPRLNMQVGLNKYDLDLSEINSFQNDQEYILKVWLINNRELRLRFLYKNE